LTKQSQDHLASAEIPHPYRRRHGAASLVQSVASPSQLVGPVVRKHWLDDPLGI